MFHVYSALPAFCPGCDISHEGEKNLLKVDIMGLLKKSFLNISRMFVLLFLVTQFIKIKKPLRFLKGS
jgi:hypothetical protein